MIRSRRTKPRPGRLEGEDLEQLRRACFERDGRKCKECGIALIYQPSSPMLDSGYHMAHRGAKRRYGDSLENVRALCGRCHRNSHNAGGKPVPRKPRP